MPHTAINILKAIAVIFMVMASSACPGFIAQLASMLSVSLLFVAAGYCFRVSNLDNEAYYVKEQLKKYYLPFVKWSFILLLFNVVWFYTGILSEQYGDVSGEITHPLNLHQWMQSLWSIIFNMSGYDRFLGETFWIFRALLIASIAFVAGTKVIEQLPVMRERHFATTIIIAITTLSLAFWQNSDGLNITGISQGGYRELMGTFLFAIGYLYQQYKGWTSKEFATDTLIISKRANQPSLNRAIQHSNVIICRIAQGTYWLSHHPTIPLILSGTSVVMLAAYAQPSMAAYATSSLDIICLAISGLLGFIFILHISRYLQKSAYCCQFFNYIGERAIYIIGWYVLAFKPVSMIKVAIYDYPWQMIGNHPIIFDNQGSYFWLLYTFFGLSLPLAGLYGYHYIAERTNFEKVLSGSKTALFYTAKYLSIFLRCIFQGIAVSVLAIAKGFQWVALKLWKGLYNFCISFVDTVKASADVNPDDDDEEEDELEEEEDTTNDDVNSKE